MGDERRRAARINARLWSRLEGVDTDWKLRRCNLSVSGVFIELDREVGEPGSVQKISLRSQTGEHEFTSLARVIRVIASSDIWHGRKVAGMAFQFMPENVEIREGIESLTRHLLSSKPEPAAPVAQGAQVNMPAQLQTGQATLKSLSVSGMVLETSWAAQEGEVIRCEIQAPGSQRTFRLAGEVMGAVPQYDANGQLAYHVQVQFHDAQGRTAPPPQTPRVAEGLSIGDAIDALLEEAVFTPKDTGGFEIPNEHLGGLLSRIRLPSLLGFIEIERLTGTLTLIQGANVVRVYLLGGQVVDADTPENPKADPMKTLEPCLNWTEGKFEFALGEITRTPRITMSTTHLLLKLMTEAEEAAPH